MRVSALCVCFTAIPLAVGVDPNRVMFPFRLPEDAQVNAKSHKVAGEKRFQHTCFDFVYAMAKLESQTPKSIDSFCTMGSRNHCEKWSDDLAQILQQKKLKTKASGLKGPRTYSQWCSEVFSMPEGATPAPKLHVMGESAVPKQLKHQEEQPKPKTQHDTAKVSLKHHSVPKVTLSKQSKEAVPSTDKQTKEAVQPTDKLQGCVCNTRDGHEVCNCDGSVKTTDGVLDTPKFSAASVMTRVEGYEISEAAKKFNAADSKVAGNLDSAIASLDKAFNASHKLIR